MKHINLLITFLLSFIAVYFLMIKFNVMIGFKIALHHVIKIYGRDIAENVERIFRLETNHFKSGQFKGTLSPGMEKFSDKFPYGWNTLNKVFWSNNPEFAPVGFKPFTENKTGKIKYFLVFPNIKASVFTLAAFLKHYGNNPGRWFSLDDNSQKRYNSSISKIKPEFTNEMV